MTPLQTIKAINRYFEDPDERELEGLLKDAKRTLIDCHNAFGGLLAWEEQQGGWEAPCWKHARRLMKGKK